MRADAAQPRCNCQVQPDAIAVARWMEQIACYLELSCSYPAKRDIICSAAHMQDSAGHPLYTDGQTEGQTLWQSLASC